MLECIANVIAEIADFFLNILLEKIIGKFSKKK